jgi:hypothetical protein
MSARSAIRLPKQFRAAVDKAIQDQLVAIGQRVYDLVAPSVDEARGSGNAAAKRDVLMAGHAAAVSVFESECLGYFHNVRGGLDVLNALACKAGCTFCCELRVEVTALEAVAIWGELAAGGNEFVARNVTDTAPRTQNLDDERRRQARIPCGLLREGNCATYASRPYACRGMYSMSAVECQAVMLAPPRAPLPVIRSPAVPRALAGIFFVGINAALKDKRLQNDTLELNSAVAALIARPAALDDWLEGKKVFPVTK